MLVQKRKMMPSPPSAQTLTVAPRSTWLTRTGKPWKSAAWKKSATSPRSSTRWWLTTSTAS